MPSVEDPLLGFLPLLLVGGGFLALLSADLLGRLTTSLLVFLSWLGGAALLLVETLLQLEYGGWSQVATGGWTGIRLLGQGPLPLVADPMTLPIALSLHLAGGALLLTSGRAWGGGRRRENTPLSGNQLGGALMVLGVLEAQALSTDWAQVFALCALASVGGSMLLLTARSHLEGLTGAGRLFIVHRLGDLGLFFAAALILAGFSSLDPERVLAEVLLTSPTTRGVSVLAGYPASWIYNGIALALAFFVASRVSWFPFSGLMDQTTQAPMSLLGCAHGMAFASSGLIVALKVAPLWALAPGLMEAGAAVAGLSAVILAASALASDDIVTSIHRLLYGLAALISALIIGGQVSTALLGLLIFVLALPVILIPIGACVEAMQGQTALSGMGGLAKHLRKSDAVITLGTLAMVGVPGLVGFFFFERAAFGAINATRTHPAGAAFTLLFVLLFTLLFTLGLWRIVHLAFTGDGPRAPAPAVLVEATKRRLFLPAFIALLIATAGFLWLLPEAWVGGLVPSYFVPFDAFVSPALPVLLASQVLAGGEVFSDGGAQAAVPSLPASAHWGLMAGVAVVSLIGYALSAILFRRGGRPQARAQLLTPMVLRAGELLDQGLGAQRAIDRVISVPVSQASRLLVGVLLPFLVDAPLSRLPGLLTGVLQSGLRVAHSGDVQRAAALIAAAIGFALWWAGGGA